MKQVTAPVSTAERVQALDTIRGFAVLGILIMNIWSFSGPQEIYDNPSIVADWGGAPLQTWAIVHTLFEGSQRALFSMLFGAGMLLMVSRLQAAAPDASIGKIYYRRIFLLMAFGLFDAFALLWVADILFIYGLCGLLLYPLRQLSTRALLLLAVIVFTIPATIRTIDWQQSIPLQQEYIAWQADPAAAEKSDEATAARMAAWEVKEKRAHPDLADPKVQESIRITGSGALGEFVISRMQVSLILIIFVGIKSLFLDSLGAMLLGMALFRSGVLTLQAPPNTYVLLAALGYGIGLPVAAWESSAMIAANFDAVLKMRNLIHYDVRRIAVGLGHLGTILLFCRALPGNWLMTRIAAVGRMALSNYLGQSILCGLIFYTVGLGLYGQFTGYYLYLVVAGIWLVQIAFSNWWLTHYRFGPFEWVWRSLTYGKRQPLRCAQETQL
ncbi:MAG: DUF418 domain-containing protein [Gammaproteobacteria bacterium]|jgi:uncharacterized protein|nr:hypothetical protein [Chromatiales bacterium]MCP4925221.1 DUF418 domain-containing protein [Gammaproteobacteria bacterium]MDP7153205.1 DUF418 domain-containing protein [Gammaproteobacteria bacterium]MDP7296591.1 DUF418 domain-containing protein [Gammaproteobacteria bacterium]MDP7419245.1 DUF418 domain-containing protein [Gammaproteobacteria bacterium]